MWPASERHKRPRAPGGVAVPAAPSHDIHDRTARRQRDAAERPALGGFPRHRRPTFHHEHPRRAKAPVTPVEQENAGGGTAKHGVSYRR